MQGSEAKDMLLGHIFGLTAVVQAGRVHDMAVRKQVATQLLLLGGKKAFVQELAVAIFLQIAGICTSLQDAVSCCVYITTSAENEQSNWQCQNACCFSFFQHIKAFAQTSICPRRIAFGQVTGQESHVSAVRTSCFCQDYFGQAHLRGLMYICTKQAGKTC